MYLTEEEAREKRCPKMVGMLNMSTFDVVYINCIASECMMWRWKIITKHQQKWGGNEMLSYESIDHEQGYCGLGGKP